ncbi:MAG: signal peptide peptidase SppA [Polyangiaceae bacterium]|nr:signal peptide peptidase SppA [Polyangiaceae bacterium]
MHIRRFLAFLGGAVLAAAISSSRASAQTVPARPERLPAFGRSVASDDDTTSLVVNPANLAFLPAPEFRWNSTYLEEDALALWQGHAVAVGTPVPIVPLATGLRFDIIDPPAATPARNYQWLTWGLALHTSDTAALGFSWQRSYSETSLFHGLSSWSFGLSTRPLDVLGLAFAAHDVNGPRSRAGGRMHPGYDMGLVLRPIASRSIELGLEARYQDDPIGYWVPRASLGIGIPYVGQLRGDFKVIDPNEEARHREWLASAMLVIDLNGASASSEFGIGPVVGTGLGRGSRWHASTNLATEIAIKGYREQTGLDVPRYAARLRIESTPDAREHVALLDRLWTLADDPAAAAVVLELRTRPASSLAHVQELRDALGLLRQNRKRVLCHLEDASGSAIYLCSAADRILINPGGGVRFAGMSSSYFYFKSLLDKLGIRAEIVRIGDHKSAPESFTRDGSTEVSAKDKIDLLQQYERRLIAETAAGRGLAPDLLRERIAHGPFVSSEAKLAGLVDGYAYDDEIEAAVNELVEEPVQLIMDPPAPRAPKYFGGVPRVALIYVEGDLVDGRSQTIPVFGMQIAGSYTLADALRQVREDPLVGAVVVRVESPGGSSMASEVIWREVQLTAAAKPTIVSMGGVAASGGYYLAASASRIFANPLTVTGSIGIFYGKADVSGLLRKIGVNIETYKTGPHADAESLFRPYTPEERQELKRKVGQFYSLFLSRVAIGRNMTQQAVDAVGRGQVWTGEQAAARGLVDELGGLRQALEYVRRMADLPKHAPIQELPPPNQSLIGRLLGLQGVDSREQLPLPAQVNEMVRALGPFVVHSGDRPLARMEYTLIGE